MATLNEAIKAAKKQQAEGLAAEARAKAGKSSKETQVILRDIKAGTASELGQEFREGSLGRIDAGRTEDISDIISRRRAGLEGLSAEENQALRERGKQGIQRGTQTALRQLRGQQAGAGVRGASATAQQAGVLRAGQQAEAGVERDLFLRNIEERRRALGEFETSVTGAEQTEEARRLFNIEQTGRETFGRVSAGLGIAGLAVAERTGAKAAAAARASGGGGGKK